MNRNAKYWNTSRPVVDMEPILKSQIERAEGILKTLPEKLSSTDRIICSSRLKLLKRQLAEINVPRGAPKGD